MTEPVPPNTPGAAPLRSPINRIIGRNSLPRQVASLAIWPALELLSVSMVGLVDVGLAGHLGEHTTEATNAVGVGSFVLWLIGMLQGALGVGATAIVARHVGAKELDHAEHATGQAVALMLAWGLCISLFLVVCAPLFGRASNLSGLSLAFSNRYLFILALASLPRAIMFIAAACLRGAGDMRTPFNVVLLMNAINIIVSSVLVLAPAPIGGWGITGIAIGTAAGWSIAGLIGLLALLSGKAGIQLHWRHLPIRRVMAWRIVNVAAPNLLENVGMWAGSFAVLGIVGYMAGQNAVGATIILIKIEAVSFLPGFALGIAAATLTGQYLGAGNPRRAALSAWVCYAYGGGIMIGLGLLFIAVPHLLISLLSKDPYYLSVCPPALRIVGFVQFAFAAHLVFSKALQGAGDTRLTMAMTYLSMFLIRVPGVWIMIDWFENPLIGAFSAICIELLVRGALFTGRFIQGGWKQIQV